VFPTVIVIVWWAALISTAKQVPLGLSPRWGLRDNSAEPAVKFRASIHTDEAISECRDANTIPLPAAREIRSWVSIRCETDFFPRLGFSSCQIEIGTTRAPCCASHVVTNVVTAA
jgi:hypothetical protein